MRISELSRASGVPVPTLKFYLREGVLPSGVRTARNQARYDTSHLARLRLIRILVEVGGLSLSAVRRVVAAIDDPSLPLGTLLGVAHSALGPRPAAAAVDRDRAEADDGAARREVDRLIEGRGWRVRADAPARRALADALLALERQGWPRPATDLTTYADVADRLAAREVSAVPAGADRAATVESVVVGTVVFERILNALRRLAQEHHSRRRFGD